MKLSVVRRDYGECNGPRLLDAQQCWCHQNNMGSMFFGMALHFLTFFAE